ncbi:sulfotransferase family protein [Trichothermofontia sp.]
MTATPTLPAIDILALTPHPMTSDRAPLLSPHPLLGHALVPEVDPMQPYQCQLGGWVLSQGQPVATIAVLYQQQVLRQTAVNLPSPDIATQYDHRSDASGADRCRFQLTFSLVGLPSPLELEIQAGWADQTAVTLATLRLRHPLLQTPYQPRFHPLILTSLGRTGSTWFMRLISQHPQIVTHRVHPYETRIAQYWLQMLKVLTQPADPVASTPHEGFEQNLNWIGANPFARSGLLPPAPATWLAQAYVTQLAIVCQQSIDGFYGQLAEAQQQVTGDPQSRCYFAEKWVISPNVELAWQLYPQAREVILVRDFRDMVCSMLAFNAKRGYASFGRQKVASDAEFIRDRVLTFATKLLRRWQHRPDQIAVVRYEDLIQSPVPTLTRLLTYLDLPPKADTIAMMQTQALSDSPDLQYHRTSESVPASIGRWQTDLTPDLQDLCHEVLAEPLQAFGYM